MAAVIVRKGRPLKTKASVGWSTRAPLNYRENFFDRHPELRGKVEVHRAIEGGPDGRGRYPGLFTPEEIASYENQRGVAKTPEGSAMHRKKEHIRGVWDKFYLRYEKLGRWPTREEVLSHVDLIDDLYGDQFIPNIR